MPKLSIAEKKAKLEAELKALGDQEKKNEQARFTALGAGIDAAMKAESYLESTVMDAINKHLRNNKQREILGLDKITTGKGRPKSGETPPALTA